MIRRLWSTVGLTVAAAASFWWLTEPTVSGSELLSGLVADPVAGERVFDAGGCASCHSAPGAEGDARRVLSGGRAFASPFGTFYAPNISPDPEHGIGRWSTREFINALRHGVSPDGRHYYPVFPYAAYGNAEPSDLVSLRAFLQSLPPSDTDSRPHDVGFPFNIRRLLGGWKVLFLRPGWVVNGDLTPRETRGRYLAEALGHCTECHTPRNALGAIDRTRWLGGAPNPAGKGRVPNITPGRLRWSESDIAEYLDSGFTPDFDTAGAQMAEVIENTSRLTPDDRTAIAAYLKKVPPLD